MTDHALMILIGGVFGLLQLGGLVILGLQLRQARREAAENFRVTGGALTRIWQDQREARP